MHNASLSIANERSASRTLVKVFLHKNIQYITILINGPPEIMVLAIDVDKQFVEEPCITGTPFSMANLVGKLLTELETPLPYSFISDDNAPCSK